MRFELRCAHLALVDFLCHCLTVHVIKKYQVDWINKESTRVGK